MSLRRRIVSLSAILLLVTLTAFGQATTSALTGTVTTEGKPLPGVTVTISSPSLLGTRTTVTGPSGDYYFPGIAPGRYDVRFELEGMQTVTRRSELRLAETSRVDSDLKVSAVAESITVTASAPSVLETTQVSTNISAEMVEELPLGRTIRERIQIAPGVQSSGTNGQTVINGAQSFDNLYLVNGVVVNENLRGQPDNAVIEEAIQETTLLVGGVSAEYGRFTGGVISTITKSGGNEFSGSFRDNITNDKWISKTAFAGERDHIDKINSVYEATLGGRIIRDRLWFFAAGRKQNSSNTNQTQGLNLPFTTTVDQKRYEGKLTGNITAKHTLTGSYLSVDDIQDGTFFGNIVDLASLRASNLQIELWSGHYNGVITNNLLIEGQYSQKDRAFVAGSEFRDRIFGTMVRDTTPGTLRRGWSPTFCGSACRPKERNNMEFGAKASYFLSTPTLGSHNLTAGYNEFHELRNEDNYQSGSDFRFFGPFNYVNGQLFVTADPTVVGTATRSRIQWDPLLQSSQTADLETKSLYVNDKWSLGQKWSFNLGVRFDQTSGLNQARIKTSDDSRVSPRLGAIYDIKGDGHQRVSLSYGRYAAKIDGAVSDATSPAGRYATYVFRYNGPALNMPGTPTSQLLPTDEVLRRVFAWFDANGGANPNSPLIFQSNIPGQSVRIDKPLHTPYMDEITLGYGMRLGNAGYVRGDLIHREWADFYVLRTDLTTGRTPNGRGDVGLIENGDKDDFERNYNGVQIQASYRLLSRFNIGGNYTWSKLRGNVEGEEFNNATIPVGVVQPGGTAASESPNYPQYTTFAQNRPVGFLMGDIRHRANLWISLDTPVPFGSLNLSVLERYHTGQSFSATAPVPPTGVTNPGYAQPPSAVQYYFSERGGFRLDDITSTDLNALYSFPITKVNFFIKADLINAFNEQGIEFVENPTSTGGAVINKAVLLTTTRFNPLTETPVLGVHYNLPATFGQATNKDAYQLPRTYRVAVGVRF